MEHYAGLDLSLKEISICVVDHDGKTIARGACPADPEGVAGWFRNRSLTPHWIVHESGMLAVDGKVEERQITVVFGGFEPYPDGPDVLGLERSLLTNDPALFPSGTKRANGG